MKKVVIVGAARTPLGRFLGALSKYSAVDLAVAAARPLVESIGPENIDQTILGNVLSSGLGQNPARQVALGLGIPIDRPAFATSMVCGSGMQAVILGSQAIRCGDAEVVLCGGTESMSNAPFLLPNARGGLRLGDAALKDAILSDGLMDAYSGEHMGFHMEGLAEELGITREAQDTFAYRSQQQWAMAQANGVFASEIVGLPELSQDEHPRPDTPMSKLSTLKPAFKRDGTVTAGNASGINDGAAMLVLCSEESASRHGWKPLASIFGSAAVGCEPARFGEGPVHAVQSLCKRHGLSLGDFDAIEINEAFAAQALACVKLLNLAAEQINVHGGAIAMGHPIGASGARILVHLAHGHLRGDMHRSLATLCIGGGMGSAVALGSE